MIIVVILLVAIIIGLLLMQSDNSKEIGVGIIGLVLSAIPSIIGIWIFVQIVKACM